MTRSPAGRSVVVIDNRDSFVFNLARYLVRLTDEVPVEVVPAHETTLEQLAAADPVAVVISPGPCTPAEAGISVEAVRWARGRVPLLGVCLGHQAIAVAYGGTIVRAEVPLHGRTSLIAHHGSDVFAGLPAPFVGCRYHSLVVDEATLPAALVVTARDERGTVMGIADQPQQVYGVQFHPEAVLTEHGYDLLANFLRGAGLACHDPRSLADAERQRAVVRAEPTRIVTF